MKPVGDSGGALMKLLLTLCKAFGFLQELWIDLSEDRRCTRLMNNRVGNNLYCLNDHPRDWKLIPKVEARLRQSTGQIC